MIASRLPGSRILIPFLLLRRGGVVAAVVATGAFSKTSGRVIDWRDGDWGFACVNALNWWPVVSWTLGHPCVLSSGLDGSRLWASVVASMTHKRLVSRNSFHFGL
jgi:hypothetical protein